MAGHEWEDWFEREEFIGQISDIRVQNLQVEREVVQKRTFTRWMNLHLEKCNPPIEVHDLFRDIQDGQILMALLEELSGCKLLNSFKKSSHRIFRLNNIAKVLSFLEDRNVKLVSIDAADVADGNSSIILGLIWNIILFFQIKELTVNIRSQFPSSSSLSSIPTSSDSDVSYCSTPSDERQPASVAMREHSKAIKKLLQWVQKRTRKYGVAVQDFGKSWTSGVAFLAVIKSIDPSLVDMRKALLRSPRENLENAFRIAHYSLGIPRLLEPEDLHNNAPDEQCIITYVSQFLKHFPGLEELEEPSHCIERSVSMGLLQLRDSDYHIRNSGQQSRVKERSYIFLRDYAKPPPKILISSVSEDRSSTSSLFRPATIRSWSSEDILADSPHMDNITSSVVEDPKEPINESLNSLEDHFPQLSFTSSVLESVTSDSAINSPDSWVESELGVAPEKFYKNKNESLLCEREKAWDVYHATPVEVTTLDEGFVPSLEDKAPDDQSVNESHIDEGIYSLSSLESNQEPNKSHTDKMHMEEVKEKRVNPENYNQHKAQEQEPDQKKTIITKEVHSKLMDTNQTDEIPREQQPAFGFAEILTNYKTGENNHSQLISKNELPPYRHSEENLKHSLEKSTEGEAKCLENLTKGGEDHEGKNNSLIERNYSEDAQVENECQSIDSLLEDKRDDLREVLKETKEQVVETLGKVNEGVLSDCSDYERSICKASSTNLETSRRVNVSMISFASGPEKQSKEKICDLEKQAGEEDVQQTEVTLSNAADTDVSSPQKQEDLTCDFIDQHNKDLVMVNPCIISQHLKPTDCGQKQDIKKGQLDHTDEHNNINCSTFAMCVCTTDNVETYEAKKECDYTLTLNPEKDITAQMSIENIAQEKKPKDTFSQNERNETKWTLSELVTSELNGKTETLCFEATSVSRNMDFFYSYVDQSTEDIVGDPIEPMDLFYPDKEEPMLTDPQDSDTKSWPSVLSVSALEPAPTAKALTDDNLPNMLDNDWWNEVITNQGLVKTSESQEQCLLSVENLGGPCVNDVPGDGCSDNESEQPSPGSASESTEPVSRREESQTSSVLRHRKGAWFTEDMDCPSTVLAVTKKANSSDSDFRCSENRELYLVLLLWLLLYSFWMLPQMDLKTLPNVLLNLNP